MQASLFRAKKIKNTFLISSLLRDSRGNNFEFIIDNFELSRSDLTSFTGFSGFMSLVMTAQSSFPHIETIVEQDVS